MPALARTSLRDIVLAINDRLVAKNVLPQDRIWISMKMNVPVHDQADHYITILPLHQWVFQDCSDGAGRYYTEAHGRINTYLRCRLSLDESYRDKEWLTNETLGALSTYHKIIDALQMYLPTDDDGNAILMEPMRLVYTNEPRKERQSPDWGEIMLEWQVVYALNLDVSVDV